MSQDDAGPGDAGPGEIAPPAPVAPGSIGILGGTFDPIHHGHLLVAEEVREALGLERVVLIPAAVPPHKPGRPVTAAEHRLAMVTLAIAGNPALAVSRVELDRGGASYTLDTLRAIAARWTAGRALVVVHGGGKRIDSTLAALGIPKRTHQGLRVTDGPTLDVVVSVLSGLVNKTLGTFTQMAPNALSRRLSGKVIKRATS